MKGKTDVGGAIVLRKEKNGWLQQEITQLNTKIQFMGKDRFF
jgi:hypothetical protein